jgi:hypothetical protein
MATTVSFTASMRTRRSDSASNYKASAASQEFYSNTYNFVGIVHFTGMSLANKIITGITLRVTSAQAGFGAGTTKTVYVRKSKYQAASQSGVTGAGYYGDALGTFTGSFYGNTTSYDFSGSLFDNLAAYFQAGNNTICLFNPSPATSGQGYSYNYLQWDSATLTVTYEDGVSQPSVSASPVDMGGAVTIYTNRLSTSATHTISYSFAGASGVIGSSVGVSVQWTPPLSLAQQIPSATSGLCTVICETYYSGVFTGTKTCTITLNVPASVVPAISNVNYSEAVAGIAAQFAGYVQSKSKLSVSIAAFGAQSSTITVYRVTLGGSTYTASSFTTGFLSVAGNNTLTVTVTDSRGRTATTTRTISVLAYSPPTLSLFKAERCNSTGSAPQADGNRVRISANAGASSVNAKNTMSCTVYYKLSTASVWTQSTTIAHSNYAIASTNLLLSQTFDVLSSFDLIIRITDFFHTVEQSVSIGTKQVMMDFFRNGTGIAFGKVAETAGAVEFGWPLMLVAPLSVAQGGTGATSATAALAALGAAAASHSHALAACTGTLTVAAGGTGATDAATARNNLGITLANLGAAPSSHSHAASAITSGMLAAGLLPYKFAFGKVSISGSIGAYIYYSSAGFTSIPVVFATYSTTDSNWSGDYGSLKVHSKTTTQATIIIGGSFSTLRDVDWIAIGT